MPKRRKKKMVCIRYRTKTEIQDYGPAKKRRVCAKRVPAGSKLAKKKYKGWCVYKGKSKVAKSCHIKKSTANRAARAMQKRCKAKIRVKRA